MGPPLGRSTMFARPITSPPFAANDRHQIGQPRYPGAMTHSHVSVYFLGVFECSLSWHLSIVLDVRFTFVHPLLDCFSCKLQQQLYSDTVNDTTPSVSFFFFFSGHVESMFMLLQ